MINANGTHELRASPRSLVSAPYAETVNWTAMPLPPYAATEAMATSTMPLPPYVTATLSRWTLMLKRNESRTLFVVASKSAFAKSLRDTCE